MLSPVSSILHRATRGTRKLNVISFSTHERYQSNLAETNANFYLWQGPHIKDWKNEYAVMPNNHIMLTGKDTQQLPINVQFDLVLSQNKFGQFNIAKQISQALHIPLISLEHTLPLNQWDKNIVTSLSNMRGDINLFISKYSMRQWGFDEKNAQVLHHGVNTELFKPRDIERENVILSVVNDWINRDHCCNFRGWQRITNGLKVKPIGSTPGLSLPAKNTTELIDFYTSSRIFINTSTVSPIPYSLMEAMACGCAVVSTATCMIPEIIEDGVNGFISNDESVLRKRCIQLLEDEKLAQELGKNARNTIIEKFGLEKFTQNWNNVLERASNIICRGF